MIESFSAGSHAGEFNVVIAHLVDGDRVHLSGTAGWAPFLGKRLAEAPARIAAELETALREAKGFHTRAKPGLATATAAQRELLAQVCLARQAS